MEADPIGPTTREMNVYTYVNSRPTIAADPRGLAIPLETHPVALGFNHSKVTIIPECQPNWLTDPRFKNRTASGVAYATIGAGSEGGYLVSNINRPTDVDRSNNNYADFVRPPVGTGEDRFVQLLIDTDAKYKDKLDYEVFPQSWTDGYNSNSFACGLLKIATGVVPSQPPDTPGFGKPVPTMYFQ